MTPTLPPIPVDQLLTELGGTFAPVLLCRTCDHDHVAAVVYNGDPLVTFALPVRSTETGERVWADAATRAAICDPNQLRAGPLGWSTLYSVEVVPDGPSHVVLHYGGGIECRALVVWRREHGND